MKTFPPQTALCQNHPHQVRFSYSNATCRQNFWLKYWKKRLGPGFSRISIVSVVESNSYTLILKFDKFLAVYFPQRNEIKILSYCFKFHFYVRRNAIFCGVKSKYIFFTYTKVSIPWKKANTNFYEIKLKLLIFPSYIKAQE